MFASNDLGSANLVFDNETYKLFKTETSSETQIYPADKFSSYTIALAAEVD